MFLWVTSDRANTVFQEVSVGTWEWGGQFHTSWEGGPC